jgi:formylglycine-generating enzyme required for sulfatase activity
VAVGLVSVPQSESKLWIGLLEPISTQLLQPLQASYRDRNSKRASERVLAAAALGDYLKDQPKGLVQLILLADTNQEFRPLLEALRPRLSACVGDFRAVIDQLPPPLALAGSGDWFWKGQANAAVCLMGLNETDAVWPLLKHSQNESLRSFLIDRLARLGADYRILGRRLDVETEPSIRQALILALGEYDARKLSIVDRRELVAKFTSLYRDDPDAGVHSAAGWALKRYGMEPALGKLDAELRSKGANGYAGSRHWFTNSKGLTFLVVDGPVEFATTTSVKRLAGLPEKKAKIGYRFAIATTEVTAEQLEEYENRPRTSKIPGSEFNNWAESLLTKNAAPDPNCPAVHVSWYRAAAYCNWLSKQEGIPKNQWCYEANERHNFGDGMKIPADFLRRTGYRLPTQLEWEYALRANTHTTYAFGDSDELLDRYVWYAANSNRHGWPVALLKPNTLGMFDMLGNATEWCQDRAEWQVKQSPPAQIDIVKDDQIRMQQGGSFNDVILSTRYATPTATGFYEGFRPVRTLP